MIDYIKVERRSGTTTRCVEMVNAAAEAGKRVALVCGTERRARELRGVRDDVRRLSLRDGRRGWRFDRIIVDLEVDGGLGGRGVRDVIAEISLALPPDGRMTVFHT